MRAIAILALTAASLGGCDYLGMNAGANEAAAANQAATGNVQQADAGGKPGQGGPQQGLSQAGDAGVTTSRSLQAFSGNLGGKSPGGGGAIDPQNLVGNWTDNGDCSQVTEIYSDGSFRAISGEEGNWRLDGDVLTFSAGSNSASIRLQSADGQNVTAIDANGQISRSTRC